MKRLIIVFTVLFTIAGCQEFNQCKCHEEQHQNAKSCGCQESQHHAAHQNSSSAACISEQEVVDAQTAWGNGIVEIGKVFTQSGDYQQAAADHINKHYAYDESLVLFKPTLAADKQFRATFDSALSYFVGGNATYPEDSGFAIKPWLNVRWENHGIANKSCNMAVAMGNYYFKTVEGDEVKVEYTLGYIRDREGNLKITVHKSSLPYGS